MNSTERLVLAARLRAVRLIKEWYVDAEDDVEAAFCRDYEKQLSAQMRRAA